MSNGNMPIGVKGRIRNPNSESCRAINDRFWPLAAYREGQLPTHSGQWGELEPDVISAPHP